jgi:uncharacterized membrane protein YidH (DUF202 family)
VERKIRVLQSVLLVLLGIAATVLAFSVWQLFQDAERQQPYANARFVSIQAKEKRV